MKRWIAAMAAAVMLLGITTACGERRNKAAETPKPTAVTATAKPTEKPTDTPEASPTPLLDTDKTLEEIAPEKKESDIDKAVVEEDRETREENKTVKN